MPGRFPAQIARSVDNCRAQVCRRVLLGIRLANRVPNLLRWINYEALLAVIC